MKKLLIATAIAAATASSAASAFSIQDGQTKMNIYGYIKGDVRYSFNQNLYDKQQGDPAAIITNINSSGADGTNGHLNFTSQQTRLGFDLTQNTDMGAIHAKLEGDWASGGHGYAYRLRHAYVEWNGVLVGQTWSNFTSWNDWANTLDWDGTVGHAGGTRYNQIRYTAKVGNGGSASIALEEPTVYGIKNAPSNSMKSQLPDINAKFEGKSGMFNYAVGVMGRQFKLDNGAGVSDTANGYGVFLSGQANLASGTTIGAGVVHGDGLGYHYMFTGEATFDAAYWDGKSIQTLSQTGASAFIQQSVTSDSFVSLAYGYAKSDYSVADGFSNSDPANFQNAFLTYQITPVQHLTYGVEYGYYKIKNIGGNSNNASQVEFSAKYSF